MGCWGITLSWPGHLSGEGLWEGATSSLTVTPPPGSRTPPADYERQCAQQQHVWEVGWMQRMLVGEQGDLVSGVESEEGGWGSSPS